MLKHEGLHPPWLSSSPIYYWNITLNNLRFYSLDGIPAGPKFLPDCMLEIPRSYMLEFFRFRPHQKLFSKKRVCFSEAFVVFLFLLLHICAFATKFIAVHLHLLTNFPQKRKESKKITSLIKKIDAMKLTYVLSCQKFFNSSGWNAKNSICCFRC